MRRTLLVAVLAALMVMASAGAAFAGEWNKGHFNEPGGNVPAKYHANSACLFNGQDEMDETSAEVADGEPADPLLGYDDGQWSMTPAGSHNNAGIRVQSGGQLIAAKLIIPGPGGAGQGVACNGHLTPLK